MACRRKANAVRHSPVCSLSIASTPTFFARLRHDWLSVADILSCGTHLAPCFGAALHCSLERGGRELVHINHNWFPHAFANSPKLNR